MEPLKITALTDFSELSKIAIEYALKMTSKLDCEFTVINVVRMDGVPKTSLKMKQLERTMLQIVEEEGARLVEELKKSAKGKTTITFRAIRSHTVADTIKRYNEKNRANLIVMGSRGASAIKKVILGGTTVSVIDICNAPVLAIPEKAGFKNFKHVVYASDLKNVQKELDTIIPFARIFDSNIHMVHVTESMDKKMEAKKLSAEELIRKANYNKIDLRFVLDDDVPSAIDRYIKERDGDLLTTFTHELNLFEKLFARSITRKLAYQGTMPLLAFKRKAVV
ncbi:MAG: universal stress protein [Cyclobacteriaceae bacterium]